ncbi:hypothetical protein DFP73DRAFT_593402 [Morchella snyderi]|nr:hypothetical protein DFP73DRAFT_593402 [Morchella snyderi]
MTLSNSTAPTTAPAKKQRPRKQVRLKKRKLAEATAGEESEDEDSKAAKEHEKQQPRKSVEESDPQEKQQPNPQGKPVSTKRKADQSTAAGTAVGAGGKKPRLPKNKRAKAKAAEENPEEEEAVDEELEGVEAEAIVKKEPRFIVFIGNLPFTTTKAALEKHFAAVQPKSVRIITHRDDPKKCKGFAFLEFEGYDRMQSCLLKFHHTVFNDGSGDRKINVELTAGGGGGKSKARKTKLETKNQKLDEQRKRKIEEEEKLKTEKKAKQPQGDNEGQTGIHPSRRRQVR